MYSGKHCPFWINDYNIFKVMAINIQPYLDKLELLKEYMFLKIDGYPEPIDVMHFFDLTGWHFWSSGHGIEYPIIPRTFEEYHRSKVPLVVAYEKPIYDFILATSSMKEDNEGNRMYNVNGQWQQIKEHKK
jgi:hypothetical protein